MFQVINSPDREPLINRHTLVATTTIPLATQFAFAQMAALGARETRSPPFPAHLQPGISLLADRILDAGLKDTDGYAALTYLCDHVGKRLSGSPELNVAIAWGADRMRRAGLENVCVQPVMVPHWVRVSEDPGTRVALKQSRRTPENTERRRGHRI